MIKDDYGHEIRVGERCAYNLSGRIAIGTITHIDIKKAKNMWNHRPTHVVHIKKLGGFGCKNGHISKVKYTNLMILKLDDIDTFLRTP
jgi:hypothetical protein